MTNDVTCDQVAVGESHATPKLSGHLTPDGSLTSPDDRRGRRISSATTSSEEHFDTDDPTSPRPLWRISTIINEVRVIHLTPDGSAERHQTVNGRIFQ
ncbi:hypothetical protein AVEN_169980-1 [Araneus ventricosus]|uniref:Uncharacterized protein n=1 Tax=Araneus ventricosus TaxID=182803 RepID=A0A4Y2VNI6_ARAVE|nr:hypothetical protein AVEN_169980-1 [Araneus ventricosus]